MKSCLKLRYPLQSAAGGKCVHQRKCVAFCAEGSEEVHVADEWDRTPTEPAKSLTAQEVLELREVQQSCMTGDSGRSQYLRVPIELLPLLPEPTTASPSSPSNPSSPPSPPPVRSEPTPRPPQPPTYHPSHLSHLPNRAAPPRPQPKFKFLPLLETPPPTPSPKQPPVNTSESKESTGESTPPSSPTDKPTPETLTPPRLHLPPTPTNPKPAFNPYFPAFPPIPSSTNHGQLLSDSSPASTPVIHRSSHLRAIPSPVLLSPSPLSLSKPEDGLCVW